MPRKPQPRRPPAGPAGPTGPTGPTAAGPDQGTRRRALPPGPAPTVPPRLDELDRRLVATLQREGRRSIAALARDLGLAESTCAARVRFLVDRGVITGFHADVDAAAVGLGVEAMVAIRFSGHNRGEVERFRDEVSRLPGVRFVHNTSGADDFLVHLAAAGPDALRDVVLDHLANRKGVVHVETSLIFETTRGVGVVADTVDG
jgi:DNA-binding Lrp family transcriptional regulator